MRDNEKEKPMNYLQIKAIAQQWCEEAGIDTCDIWHHPWKPEGQSAMTVVSVLWSLHTERLMSVPGMRLLFERYLENRSLANG
jgi:hypothetical protein